MSIHTATDKVANTAKTLADDVLATAQDAVHSTRTAANNSLEKAEEGVRSLRSQTDPVIDDLAARARSSRRAASDIALRPAPGPGARSSRRLTPPPSM